MADRAGDKASPGGDAGRAVLGLIPARGGSRGLPGKNLAPLAGKPLIAHTIAAAQAAQSLSRVVVSTDDAAIAAAAREHGAEVPFLRPAQLAADDSPALAVIRHALTWFEEQENRRFDAVAYLQPTSPLRTAAHIDAGVELLWASGAETVVSVVEVPHNFNPFSVLRLDGGWLEPYEGGGGPLRRQDKPRLYARNGPAVLVLTREQALGGEGLYGPRTRPLIMDPAESLDIDGAFDLELAGWLIARRDGRRDGGRA